MNQSLSILYIGLKSLGIESENAEMFQRPEALSGGHIPSPTARVAKPLAFGEVRLATSQFFFRLNALRSVDGSAHIFDQSPVLVENGVGQVVDIPDCSVGPDDATGKFVFFLFTRRVLKSLFYQRSIVPVNILQSIGIAGLYYVRIQVKNAKHFR